jgi:hypothetical protein
LTTVLLALAEALARRFRTEEAIAIAWRDCATAADLDARARSRRPTRREITSTSHTDPRIDLRGSRSSDRQTSYVFRVFDLGFRRVRGADRASGAQPRW